MAIGAQHARPLALRERLKAALADPLATSLGFFALSAIALLWPWLSGRVSIPWDAKATFLPQVQFLARSLHQGQSPFWTPFVFSGHPQIADPQAMIFSPPFLLLCLLSAAPSPWAVDATVLIMGWLGGAALMLWFRDRGWHWVGGLIGALVFSFGGAMAWRVQHIGQVVSLAYLPIAMLCLERALARGSLAYGAMLGLVAASIVLGRDQVAMLTLYLLAGLALWRVLAAPRPMAALRAAAPPLLCALLLTIVIIAVPLVLTALFVEQSNRPFIDYWGAARGSLHPALLLTLLTSDLFGAAGRMEDYWGPPSFAWPDTGLFIAQNMGVLYIGAIPLLLCLTAALRGQLWASEVRFFLCAAILMLAYALGSYTPLFPICYGLLPGVNLYRRPADGVFLFGSQAAILAGYAAHRLFRAPHVRMPARARSSAAGAILAALLIAVLIAWGFDRMGRIPLALLLCVCAFGIGALTLVWAKARITARPLLAAALLAAVTSADLALNNGPNSATALAPSVYEVLNPLSDNATIAILKRRARDNGRRRDRVELAGLGFHWPNASLTHGLENTLGYNPLRLALYSQATGAQDHVGLPEQRKFSPLFPSYRSTLADLLGLRLIATGVPIESIDGKLPRGALPLVARTSDGYIYENPHAFDRVLFATTARSADFARLLQDGRWPPVNLRSTVLLEDAPAGAPARRPGQVRILSYRNSEVIIEADSPDGGWVVLNDLWHPWWFADIDGIAAPILRANVLFRALAVAPGRHRLNFHFRPLLGAIAQLRHP